MLQEQAVIGFLARIRNPILLQGGLGFNGIGKPDLRSVTLIVKFCGFQRAVWHLAAKHRDGRGSLQGIFLIEPATQVSKNNRSQKQAYANNREPNFETSLSSSGGGQDRGK